MSSSDLAARVMEVTGSTRQVALNLLAACANDVQAAVDLFLANEENDGIDVEAVDVINECNEDEVRAPIAPIREQLIGPNDDNFRQATHATGTAAKARSLPRIKVCPLRDFAREGSIMEESLAGSDAIPPLIANDRPPRSLRTSATATARSSSSHSSTSTTTSTATTASTSMNRLGDLFRPPTDIIVVGTFQYARTRATNMKRWLLVNVQSDNFNSQLLNRDVWSQMKVRVLVKKHFLLWQVSADTSEGTRFATFYHCNQTPYICIIDPRTGEELWKSDRPNAISILDSLQTFLHDNSSEAFFQSGSSKAGPSSSYASPKKSSTQTTSEESSTASADQRKRTRPVDIATELTEEEQIMIAVRNSLRENGCGDHSTKKPRLSDDDNDEVFHEISDSDDDVQNVPAEPNTATSQKEPANDENGQVQQPVAAELHTAYLGSCIDEITTLKIRLVNAGVDESVTIKWPSDTKLRALQLYISERFPMVKEKFKLISPFPRKVVDLNEDSDMQTLKDANLYPSSTLHVHLDD